MTVFQHPDFDQHQTVAFHTDQQTGLKAIIAVHDTTLGPSLGGCRMFPYASEEQALTDVLRLSRGMTYKSALANIPLGGGKSVIIGNPEQDKTRELLLAMGEFIESQNGRYVGAEDSGTSVADIATMAEKTKHLSGINSDEEHGGDPSPSTAYGVFKGIEVAVDYRLGSDLKGVRVAIQGVGNVGYHLVKHLHQAGADIVVADINQANLSRVVDEFGVSALPLDKILSADVDVLAPCAMGAAINKNTISDIKAGIIAGAANNQLDEEKTGWSLTELDILYAPDYVINAGGIIDCYYQTINQATNKVVSEHIDIIGQNLKAIFHQSEASGRATSDIANEMALAVLEAASEGTSAESINQARQTI